MDINFELFNHWIWVKLSANLFFIVLLHAITSKSYARASLKNGLFILSTFALLLVSWIPNLIKYELNVDESQWIAQANNLWYDPTVWFHYFLPREFSRVFTILPLAVMGIFFNPIMWFGTRILCLLLWSGIIFQQHKGIKLLFDEHIAKICTVLLFVFVSMLEHPDMVSYNSELPLIFLTVTLLYLTIRILLSEKRSKSGIDLILLGVLVVLMPFAKEQGIIMALFIEIALIVYYLYIKSYSALLLFVLTNIITVFILFTPYLIFGTVDLLIQQIQGIFKYHSNGLAWGRAGTFAEKIKLYLTIIKFSEYAKFLYPTLLVLGIYSIIIIKGKIKLNKQQIILLLFLILFSLIAHYSCYSPGNFFGHYIILIIPPTIFLTAYAVYIIYNENNKAIQVLTILGCLIIMRYFYKLEFHGWKHNYCYSVTGVFEPQQAFTKELIKSSNPGDRLMIWGWNNAYYVESNLHPGSRELYNSVVDVSHKSSDMIIGQYIQEMNILKPKFVLELVGDKQFYTNDTSKYALKKFPELYKFISQNYQLAGIKGEETLYVRK